MPLDSTEISSSLARVVELGVLVQQALADGRVQRGELLALAEALADLLVQLLRDVRD
jgi:hypothetical protein